jgi:gliding motility-associated protein GldM
MAGGKESPRQKMIGMMYLVLTALLALNVSKEILDAFISINNGLQTTRMTFDGKLNQQYADFNASYTENPEKYGAAYAESQKLRVQADEIVAHIDNIKTKIIAETEGLEESAVIGKNQSGVDTTLNLTYAKQKDNYLVLTNIMIGAEPDRPKEDDNLDGKNYRAAVLRQKLEAYGDELKQMVEEPTLVTAIDSLFSYPTKIKDASGTMTNWESLNFYGVPLAAAVTLLSKLQNDVRNAESDVLNYLFSGVEKASYKFTELRAITIPEKTYVLENDSFRADVFLAAYDNTNLPDIFLYPDGMTPYDSYENVEENKLIKVPVGADGYGKLRLPARSIGEKSWEGIIKFRNPAGGYVYERYAATYEVAKPALVVSPTKMNVLYRGVDNPVAISVPGISPGALTATIDNGSLVRQPDGSFIVRDLKGGSQAVVSVSAEILGQKKAMGTFEFRVKSVPDPVAKFAGKGSKDNSAKKADLTAAIGVIADLEDFVFDLKFPVKSFDLTVIMGGDAVTLPSNSNRLTPDQQELLNQVRRNQTVIIENIRAQAPDGSIRSLGSINLRVI